MKRKTALVTTLIACVLLLTMIVPSSLAMSRDLRRAIMRGSVLITPLKLDASGRVVNVPWSGSGTIVDASGLILTNYHVVQPGSEWDILGISITTESDQAPAPAYLAEFAAGDEAFDLAVIRIVADAKGNDLTGTSLGLTPVALGDSDDLEIGDTLTIFGYPGIGSSTITLTEGKVSGFLQEEGVASQRAWIKTDAAISGGNSGGTAVDENGKLVAVPTRLGDIDARRIADTNGDGIIDERDDALSTGGFINQLRPIGLALQFIEQARKGGVIAGTVKPAASPTPSRVPTRPGGATPVPSPTPSKRATPVAAMDEFVFASELDEDDLPLDPASVFGEGINTLYAFTDYSGMTNKATCEYEWTIDDEVVADGTFPWDAGPSGTFSFSLGNDGDPLPTGEYALSVWVASKLLRSGGATISTVAASTPVTLSGYLYDADTGRAIQGGYLYVLAPGVTVNAFLNQQKQSQLAAWGQTGRNGYYRVSPGLPRGYTYSAVVYAQGYALIAEDGALPIDANTPNSVELNVIYLTKE